MPDKDEDEEYADKDEEDKDEDAMKKTHLSPCHPALNTVVELGRGELQLGRRVGEALPRREQRLRAGPHGKGRCLSSGGSGTHKAKCGVSAVKAVGTQGKRRRLSREGS